MWGEKNEVVIMLGHRNVPHANIPYINPYKISFAYGNRFLFYFIYSFLYLFIYLFNMWIHGQNTVRTRVSITEAIS